MDDPAVSTFAVFCSAIFCLSAVIAFALRRVPILDMPNDRSSHRHPVPRIGGVAIIASYMSGLVALPLAAFPSPGSDWTGIGLVITSLFIAVIGLLDDVGKIRTAVSKLILQCLGSSVLVLFGVSIREIPIPLYGTVELGLFGPVLTVFWLVALTNAVNFMDGLDGLAAGSCAIAALFFGLVTHLEGATYWGIIGALLAPSILGFMPFNLPRATLFMGDVGSQFLGFSLAALAVIAAQQPGAETCVFVMPLLLFHFLFDTLFTLVRRTIGKERLSQAHRAHLYQLLNRLGWSHLRVSALHFAFAVLLGFGALVICSILPEYRAAVFLPFLALEAIYAFVVMRLAVRHDLIIRAGLGRVGCTFD